MWSNAGLYVHSPQIFANVENFGAMTSNGFAGKIWSGVEKKLRPKIFVRRNLWRNGVQTRVLPHFAGMGKIGAGKFTYRLQLNDEATEAFSVSCVDSAVLRNFFTPAALTAHFHTITYRLTT